MEPESRAGNDPAGRKFMTGSYRANTGVGDPVNNRWWDTYETSDPRTPPTELRGPIHVQSRALGLTGEPLAAVTDGLSNTLMVGEYTTRSHPNRTTFWARAYTSYSIGREPRSAADPPRGLRPVRRHRRDRRGERVQAGLGQSAHGRRDQLRLL